MTNEDAECRAEMCRMLSERVAELEAELEKARAWARAWKETARYHRFAAKDWRHLYNHSERHIKELEARQ